MGEGRTSRENLSTREGKKAGGGKKKDA